MARRHRASEYDTEEASKPQVPVAGTAVHFYPAPGSEHERDNPPPCAGFVAGPGKEPGTVNLFVIASVGTGHNVSDVPVLNDGDSPPESGGSYCMPPGGKPAEPAPTEEPAEEVA